MDPLKKIEDLKLRNEALWDDITNKLGLGKKTPPIKAIVKPLGGGRYMIGRNLVDKLEGVSEAQLMAYDWQNGKLSFLVDGVWHAKLLKLAMYKTHHHVVDMFWGTWEAGAFVGIMFGTFRGESFTGEFISAFESYESDPSTFVDGSVTSFTDGILGLRKLDNIALDSSSKKKSVSLLEMQVGQYCNLIDEHGTTHSFQMLKCCDDKNMDIELQEMTGQKQAIRLAWTDIRKNNDPAEFRRLSSIRIGGRPQVPFLFANDRVGKVASIEISMKPTQFGTTTDTYQLDMSLLRPLTYPIKTSTIHLFSPDEVVKFGKIYHDLVNNGMRLHLRNIKDGIKMGIITGWTGFPHLSAVFGVEGSAAKHPKYQESMRWLDEFVQTVVLRMMRSRTQGGVYVSNDKGRTVVMNGLKAEIGPLLTPVAAPAKAPQKPVAPAPTGSIIP